jgi:hypothetical protein
MPKITTPDQIAITEDGKIKAKRLVKVAKPYRTEVGFYEKALEAAAAGGEEAPKVEPDGGEK